MKERRELRTGENTAKHHSNSTKVFQLFLDGGKGEGADGGGEWGEGATGTAGGLNS